MHTADGVTARLSAPHRLYSYAALAVAALVFAGFARSYYLRAFFNARHLTPLAHIHGILMTGWIVLFVMQAQLIAKRRVAAHRRLGVLGAALATVIVLVGSLTVAAAIHRRFPGAGVARFGQIFVEFDGLSVWVFGALALAGVLWRAHSDVHKRLMLSATVALLPPAVGRIAEYLLPGSEWHLVIAAVTTSAFAVVCALVDTLRLGRLHPAMACGTACVLAANLLTQLAQGGD
ncbi:MAG TPA: hypothetical protein VNX02_15260 [Steroidobacteraceae bacterium]|jgi:hypothetical protein|nr:hypothetical protein [Steroidobacteraceae bacterium]